VAGVDELLWPLTQASSDLTNLTKLDADGNVLTSTTDLDGRYVNVTGDTMTGPLVVKAPQPAGTAGVVGLSSVVAESGRAISRIENAGDSVMGPFLILRKDRGTLAAPTPVKNGDQLGQFRFAMANGTAERQASLLTAFAVADGIATGCDSTLSINVFAANPATAATVLTLTNSVADGRAVGVSADSFTVAANNFTVAANGFITSKNGILVQRTVQGTAGQFDTSNVGSGETGYGIQARCTGTSLTSGSVTGVRGETLGTYSVGVGVRGIATGTANTNYGLQAFASGGTARNVGLYIGADIAQGTGQYAVECQSDAFVFFKGHLGLNIGAPTHQLEVGGDSMLRGPLEVVGNITSTGTAHAFANGSIPSPAVIGNIPRTIAATGSAGSAGQMVWDENFLYLRVLSGWKKVALTAI
jgi:hypothetical protein